MDAVESVSVLAEVNSHYMVKELQIIGESYDWTLLENWKWITGIKAIKNKLN